MILDVPNLRRQKLLHLMVCARFPETGFPDDAIARWKEPAVVPVRRGRQTEFLRIRLHKAKEGLALHIEVAAGEWFEDGPPKRSRSQREVDAMVRAVLDKTGSALVAGEVTFKKSELPESSIIRASGVSVEATAVSMEVIGSRFRIRGTPFQFLEWAMTDDKKETVTASLVAIQDVAVVPSLLVEQANFIRLGFDTLIFGKASNA